MSAEDREEDEAVEIIMCAECGDEIDGALGDGDNDEYCTACNDEMEDEQL